MSIENREEIEWSNTWISNANTYNKRCLLIGDSITRQIRVAVENMIYFRNPTGFNTQIGVKMS